MTSPPLDLLDVLSFEPGGGIIRFLGRRAVIFDAVALGLLRRELASGLGILAARAILTRVGYAAGRRTAEALQQEHPELWVGGAVGPSLQSLAGHLVMLESKRGDGKEGRPLIEATGKDNYEVEQHLLYFGRSDQSACWFTSGFASGYLSFKEGREVYFIEDECQAMGHARCHSIARFREEWGPEVEKELRFFRLETIDQTINGLSTQLRETERMLLDRQRELGLLDEKQADPPGLIVRSDAMRLTLDRARHFARTSSSVLITGESGVGKEVLARYLHSQSERARGPFISLNCGAMPEHLLESELFGHARGAFTGADSATVGLFEAANGGTLLLDEVGEISLAMQVKLLRALQEREIRRVGETKARPIDVRILSATNRDLKEEMQAGRFRQDLYFRLHVIALPVPPLRERLEDVLPLARFFLKKQAKASASPATGFSREGAQLLRRYAWPGNVRELQNAVEHALALCTSEQIGADDLPEELRQSEPIPGVRSLQRLVDVEREHILSALRAQKGNRAKAARWLGISTSTMYRKLHQFEVAGMPEVEEELPGRVAHLPPR